MQASGNLLNDVHSQLNPTRVARIERPTTLSELRSIVKTAAATRQSLSIAGGRHAMGGQQFAAGHLHIDLTGVNRVLGSDGERGWLTMEAGATWPAVIAASHSVPHVGRPVWAIRQKQTGVDAVTLGGSVSANAHGRGLLMQPLGDDIERLVLVNANGELVECSRSENAELFSLVIGGYGLFGIVYAITLRLAPRLRLRRAVDVMDLDDAMNAVFRRTDEGCLYGDFQFVIDAADDRFLRRGVFACYKPIDADGVPDDEGSADLEPDAWLQLLRLAHEDKRAAFRLYASHYLGTDGNLYWSDTMQLSTYVPSYADSLADRSGEAAGGTPETLVIGEHYVEPGKLPLFMSRAGEILRIFGTEVIYGTIRSIRQDRTSFLPWARSDFACVIFNLRTPHDAAGIARTGNTFRALTELSIELGGSFFLTYHRAASASQVVACYPRFREWLAKKRLYDPSERFTSTWYAHYREAFAAEAAH